MQDEIEGRSGASRDPSSDRLLGEVLGSLSDWRARYPNEHPLDLALVVSKALFSHVSRYEGTEAWLELNEVTARLSQQTVDDVTAILDENQRCRMN